MASDTGSPDVPGLAIITATPVAAGANGENEEKTPISGVRTGAPTALAAPRDQWLPQSVAAEAVDRGQVPFAQRRIADPEPFGGGQEQHADLALVRGAGHLPRGLGGLLLGVRPGEGGVDAAQAHQPVRRPRLAVVGEVAADDPFQVHPQVPVVVLVQVPAGGGAGDDGAAALGDEDAGTEGLPARVLED